MIEIKNRQVLYLSVFLWEKIKKCRMQSAECRVKMRNNKIRRGGFNIRPH